MNGTLVVVSATAALVFVALDCHDAQFVRGWWRQRARACRNVAYLCANVVTMVVLSTLSVVVKAHVTPWWVWPGPHAIELLSCVLVAEFINWLAHFIKHRQRWLWTFHLQHHVERNYNSALTLHTHGVEVVVTGTAMALVLHVLGFRHSSVDVFTALYFVANLFKHCSAPMSLGVLDWLVVGPAYHRVHHSAHHEGNYGSVLTVFDRLFGTAIVMPLKDATQLTSGTRTPEAFGFVAEFVAPLRPRP